MGKFEWSTVRRAVLVAVVLSVGLPVCAQAAPIDLLTQANVRLDGAASDVSGSAVSGAGDFNADGTDDVIIGAPFASNNARSISGSSYVVFGSAALSTIDLATLTPAQGIRIDGGAAVDQSGYSVSDAGDVNADGTDDVIIGAPNADNNTRTNSGSSYVVFGSATPSSIDLATLTPMQGIRIDGAAAGDGSGFSVSGAADVNADGTDDVIIGAIGAGNNARISSGSSYVVFGSAAPSSIDLAALTPAQGIRIDGAAISDQSGYSVSGAGDVNADGTDDVIVGASDADNNARLGSGSSYVVFGSATPSNIDLAALTPAQGIRIDGAAAFELSGLSVSGAGDVDADGTDDVIIGAPAADSNARGNSGSSYVVFGSATPSNIDLATLTSAQGIRIDGAATGNQSGFSVSGAGDVNADGTDDVIVGAPTATNNAREVSGSSYVVFGSATPSNIDLATLTSAQGVRIDGAATGDQSGYSVSGARDVNADGTDDVIVGARFADNNARGNSGSSYIIDFAPPAAPVLTDSDPDSPANDNSPRLEGTAEAGTTVELFTNATCTGSSVASGSAAAFATSGLAVAVADNSSTTFHATATDAAGNESPCSASGLTYVEDSTPPAAPVLSDSDPDSPANDNAPRMEGTAEAGSTVRLYTNPMCTGASVVAGSAAAFASPGLTVAVADNSSTTFYATATDAAGNVSACSASGLTYVEDSINTPPVATDDAYGVIGGATLTVPAPGVLANDSDADGDVLTAQPANPTTKGTLNLHTDGSFTYTPGEDATGTDTFTYRAFDGTDTSTLATVTITIAAGCEGKPATITGTAVNNVINGTGGNDVIVGLGGNDRIDGGSGNDTICGGSGNDTLVGGSGNDTLRAGTGDDRLDSGSGDDTLHGDDGDDVLDAGGDDDRLFGGVGIDRLLGGGGDDRLDGGTGTPDRCDGEGGSDTATACETTLGVP